MQYLVKEAVQGNLKQDWEENIGMFDKHHTRGLELIWASNNTIIHIDLI